MPSVEQFVDISELNDSTSLASHSWRIFAAQHSLQAILVVRHDLQRQTATVQWAHNLPVEAFNGLENQQLVNAIDECFLLHPKPHVHALKHNGFADIVFRLNKNLQPQYRMWFFPLQCGELHLTFLGLPETGMEKSLPVDLKEKLAYTIATLSGCLRASEFQSRLKVTEKFVKEVGHDLASSVQASVAKLRNIVEGRVSGQAIKVKASEVEQEIWGAYRVAESLGIVADQNYEIRLPQEFDINKAVKDVVRQFQSEASERNIQLQTDSSSKQIRVWGEKSAIQQAIGQLVLNAIKYAFGGTEIKIFTTEREVDFLIRVTDKGHPLPEGPELKQIWDFGYRGKIAKELHVNGSGIGLYTVKKITSAHLGWVDAESRDGETSFFMHIPKKAAMQRDLGKFL